MERNVKGLAGNQEYFGDYPEDEANEDVTASQLIMTVLLEIAEQYSGEEGYDWYN